MSGDGVAETSIPRGLSLEQAQILKLERSQNQIEKSQHLMMERLDNLVEQMEKLSHHPHREPIITEGAVEEGRLLAPRGQPRDQDLRIKLKIPPFTGSSSPEEFLDWVQRVEKVFECHDYSEINKCRLATIKFTDYANLWWENLKGQRRRDGEEDVKSWRLMKS